MKKLLFLFLLLGGVKAMAQQEVSEDEMKKANNPLANAKAINLQNYYVPTIYDNADMHANSMLVRVILPFANGKILTRFTMPFNTNPTTVQNDVAKYASGTGDLSFFATYTFTKPTSHLLIGAGPSLSIPTANSDYTGAGKWQLGGAFIIFNMASAVIQYGALITYLGSIAGQEDRSSTSGLQIQPFLLVQLGKGTYLRSTALSTINIEGNTYNVPIGVGLGKVVKAGKAVFNIFLEPQFTIVHYGAGQPALQLFAGINCQF
ncbi:hypothetical protein [Chitinophaga sp. Cy-1792]|uniref:hypothetical protein n=1 Tax=Chitinophaga sp. Cy-1792 TaxID=2608339 RepID=UPI00141E0F98|nr:hypothetical protein [Chitinophaga sp. Cy-1792]NIG56638.1 hypothetical protein [Chitinophaga sp. Cy-1792]